MSTHLPFMMQNIRFHYNANQIELKMLQGQLQHGEALKECERCCFTIRNIIIIKQGANAHRVVCLSLTLKCSPMRVQHEQQPAKHIFLVDNDPEANNQTSSRSQSDMSGERNKKVGVRGARCLRTQTVHLRQYL